MKVVPLIKTKSSKVRVGERLPDAFPVRNNLKKGDALMCSLFKFTPRKQRRIEIECDTSVSCSFIGLKHKYAEALSDDDEEVSLDVTAEENKSACMFKYHH
jgi:hypothetical protein